LFNQFNELNHYFCRS